jgi:hypothetical protein
MPVRIGKVLPLSRGHHGWVQTSSMPAFYEWNEKEFWLYLLGLFV